MPKPHQSLKGQLLLDGGTLSGSWFHRAVVLVCEHNEQGAFGLVLTRPSDSRVEDVLEADVGAVIGGQTLFGGGPVQPTALSFLRAMAPPTEVVPSTQALVLPGIVLGHQLEDLVELAKASVKASAKSDPVRVFAGYSGWSPGQLEGEMKRKSWLTEPATPELVFNVAPEMLWRHILKRRTKWEERLLGDSPEDLAWN